MPRSGDFTPLTHTQLVDKLYQMTPEEADRQTALVMSRLHFSCTYAFSKILCEHLVDDPNSLPGVPKVIVRPSLVHAYAGSPYPG